MPRLPKSLPVLCLLFATAPAPATDYIWNTASTGNWNADGNWTPTGIPGAGDNVTIDLAGTYTVNLNGAQSANNVTLDAASATVDAFGNNFNLGGTMTLSAGNWVMGGFLGTPVTLTGGTITRGASDTGKLTVMGDLRLMNTQIANAAAIELSRAGGGRLRLAGTSAFAPGSVITMANTGQPYPSQSGITFEEGGVVDNLTVNLGQNTTLGTMGGKSLTFGPNTVVEYADPNSNYYQSAIGREINDGNDGVITLTNQGVIRSRGWLVVGRYFDVGNSPSNVDVINAGLMESHVALDINANTFVNAPGAVLRATAGGGAFLFARINWTNQGTFEVTDGGTLHLGGRFSRDDIGTIVRSGSGTTIGIFAGIMDNSGGTWALNADTGSIQLLGYELSSSGELVGGAITSSDGAKLEVRVHPSGNSGVDYTRLTGVAVGPGVLAFPATGGKVFLQGGTTLTPGDTITLAGSDTAIAYLQTQQVDGVTFVLAGDASKLQVFDNNVLTLGPTTVVRKTDTGVAHLNGGLFFETTGTATAMVNRGLVHVEQGTLRTTGSAGFAFVNRGIVQVDAGATVTGFLTDGGGTVRGGGTVDGSLDFEGAGNHLRPGASAGTLTVTGNLTLNGGTTLHAELNGHIPGTGYDQLAVTGTVTLGGAGLELSLGNGYAPEFADTLFLIANAGDDAIGGELAYLPHLGQVPVGGYLATISYAGNTDTGLPSGGNDVVLFDFTPVPEPGSILALAAAAGPGAGLWRRARRISPRVRDWRTPDHSPA